MQNSKGSQDILTNGKVESKEPRKIRSLHSIAIEVSIYMIALFFAAFIVPSFLLQRTVVDGDSMEPTLQNGENLWVEKISNRFDKLKRFDVIVFYPYGKVNGEYFIKRIIGLPGETVQIIGETIYINGDPLDEDYGKDPIIFSGIATNELTLADDEYFVMGDNRTISFDSRYSKVGPVKKENIAGKAFLIIWPLSAFGTID